MNWILVGFEVGVGLAGAYLAFRVLRMLVRLPGALRSAAERERKVKIVAGLMTEFNKKAAAATEVKRVED